MDLESKLVAPLSEDQSVGTVTVSLGDEAPIRRGLYPLAPVAEGNIWQRVSDGILLWFE